MYIMSLNAKISNTCLPLISFVFKNWQRFELPHIQCVGLDIGNWKYRLHIHIKACKTNLYCKTIYFFRGEYFGIIMSHHHYLSHLIRGKYKEASSLPNLIASILVWGASKTKMLKKNLSVRVVSPNKIALTLLYKKLRFWQKYLWNIEYFFELIENKMKEKKINIFQECIPLWSAVAMWVSPLASSLRSLFLSRDFRFVLLLFCFSVLLFFLHLCSFVFLFVWFRVSWVLPLASSLRLLFLSRDFRFVLLLLCFSMLLFFCSCVPLCFLFVWFCVSWVLPLASSLRLLFLSRDFRFVLLLLCFSVLLFFCSCVPLCFLIVWFCVSWVLPLASSLQLLFISRDFRFALSLLCFSVLLFFFALVFLCVFCLFNFVFLESCR